MIFNLDIKFDPYQQANTASIAASMFPSGFEINPCIQNGRFWNQNETITITTRIKSSNDIMILLLVTDAIKRTYSEIARKGIELLLPYMPYARQDRVMKVGESLSVKVMADLINSQNYSKVTIFDPHSDVTPALINNCVTISNHNFVKKALSYYNLMDSNSVIVSPDAGSYKKIFKLAKYLAEPDLSPSLLDYPTQIVICDKVRDTSNGEIKDITVNTNDLKGKNAIIVDDICSRAGTFIRIAQALKKRNCGDITLIVSHYEGTADENKLKEAGITRVIKTNSMNDISSDFIINVPLTAHELKA